MKLDIFSFLGEQNLLTSPQFSAPELEEASLKEFSLKQASCVISGFLLLCFLHSKRNSISIRLSTRLGQNVVTVCCEEIGDRESEERLEETVVT